MNTDVAVLSETLFAAWKVNQPQGGVCDGGRRGRGRGGEQVEGGEGGDVRGGTGGRGTGGRELGWMAPAREI